MKLKEFFLLMGKSLSPNTYKDLASGSMKQAIIYFLGVLSLAFIITMLLYVPVLADLSLNLDKGLSKLTKLNISINIETSEPIYFNNIGLAIDTTGKLSNISNEKVLVTNKYIFTKPLKCMLFSPLCLLSKEKMNTLSLEPKNLMDYKKDMISMANTLIILLIPAIVVSLYLMYMVKYILIILLASILAFLITRIRLYEVKLSKTIKLAAYTVTPMIFIEVINLRFGFNLYFMPLVIFAALLTIGLMLIGEKAIRHKGE